MSGEERLRGGRVGKQMNFLCEEVEPGFGQYHHSPQIPLTESEWPWPGVQA